MSPSSSPTARSRSRTSTSSCPPHKTTVLVGSSGSGKTTLLRMINRMVDPTGGQVLIDGTDVATRDPVQLRRGIGYVMQNSGLLPHRRVIDNIATVPLLRGTPKREAYDARARAARHGRTRPLARRPVPQPALGRPAAARRRRSGTRGRPEHPADGRALRRRRSDRARRAAAGAAARAGRARQDDRLRHARHRRGVPARRPGRDHAGRRQDLAGRRRRPRSSRTRPTSSWRTSSGPTAASAPCT